ncbi:hypothetical protein AB7Z32_33960 [Bradyrhizobium sp. 482_C4_N1_1]|uniref:hypothetical protein n=1 Tax=Bradyrhizobium TaxID=374 RepID=UPI0024B058D2|nr:hypothetical protein [Bradyrhizobium barranii]WFT95235.1 hypothetical protein QA633_44550 [Bradyrhizobium barranii]
MKPVRPSAFDAAPADYRGKRYNHTLRLIRARDILLVMAAAYFPSSSNRETARLLLDALTIYAAGRWQRDRAIEACPPQYAGTYRLLFWAILKLHDRLPCDRIVRAAVARARQ